MGYFASDIIPLSIGTKWLYEINSGFINMDVKAEVVDSKNGDALIKISGGKKEGAVVLKSDIDLSITAYSKKSINTLDNPNAFQIISKTTILRSPVVTGTNWQNEYGTFTVIDSRYSLRSKSKVYLDCIFMQLKDTSRGNNDFYFKEGIGLLYASLHIDNIGKVNLNLKKFN